MKNANRIYSIINSFADGIAKELMIVIEADNGVKLHASWGKEVLDFYVEEKNAESNDYAFTVSNYSQKKFEDLSVKDIEVLHKKALEAFASFQKKESQKQESVFAENDEFDY